MRARIEAFARRPFVRNVATLAVSSAAAQAITLAFYPLITRIYGPEAFGVLGVFTAIGSVMLPLAGLTYHAAIVLPKDDGDALNLGLAAAAGATLVACIGAGILLPFGGSLTAFFGLERLSPYLGWVPLFILAVGAQQIVQQWLFRTGQFRLAGVGQILQTLATNGIRVILPAPLATSGALIATYVLGYIVQTVAMAIGMKRDRLIHAIFQRESGDGPLRLARRYQSFPLFRAPQTFLNALSQGLPALVLAALFGPVVVGHYALARSVLGAPLGLLSTSVGNVVYPKLAAAKNAGTSLRPILFKATAGLFLLAVVAFGALAIVSPGLFAILFGDEWRLAGEYARWLVAWLIFMVASRPANLIFSVEEKQSFLLAFEILTVTTRALALIVPALLGGDALECVIAFSVVGSILNILLMTMAWIVTPSVKTGASA